MLALTVALVGPYFVDWTSYRADFEREASRILGREVTVEGDATARLLPFPSVSFSDVRVAGATPDAPAMTIESFSMDAELAPFMRGEVLIFDMRLVRPDATIAIAEDGTIDWAVRPASRFDPSQISLEKLTITEGKVRIRHGAGGRDHLLTEVNATISARTLAGPWRLDGSARLDGMLTALAVSTGQPDENGAMRVRLQATPERYPVALETDGSARVADGAMRYAGTFKFDVRNSMPARLRDGAGGTFAVGGETAKQAPADYRFAGSFAFDHAKLDVPEFRLESGPREDPYTAEGSAGVDLGREPRFRVQATGAQVQLGQGGEGDVTGVSLEGRVAALNEVLRDLPQPAMPGTIDLDLPAIVAGDTTIRDVTLSAEPADGAWAVRSLSALLPGRTTLEAEGMLATGDEPGFKGRLLLAVAQPSGFAAWLAKDVDEAIRRLPAAGFAADVDLTTRRQHFDDLDLVLGSARFRGALDRAVRDGAAPAMTATLEGDALDVSAMAAFASMFMSDQGVAHFARHDIDFNVKAGPVNLAGLEAETVDAALRLRGDRLDVDRLSIGGLAGANISATARLDDVGRAPGGSVDASILAADLAPFVDMLAATFPDNPLARAAARRIGSDLGRDAQIDVVASLSRPQEGGSEAAVSAQGHLGQSDFTLSATARDIDGDPYRAPLSVKLEASSAAAADLLAYAGLPVLDLGGTGEAEAIFSLDGVLSGGAALVIDISSEEAETGFSGTLTTDGGPIAAEGALRLSGSDVEPWLASVGMALPGMGLGLPMEVEATARLAGGALALSAIKGSVASVPLEGELTATVKEGLPDVRGALSLGSLDLTLAAALVLGEGAIQDEGAGWPDTPFIQSVIAPFSAELDLAVASLGVGPWLTVEDARLNAAVGADGLRIGDLDGRFLGGTIEGLAELRNNDGTGLFSGQVAIKGASTSALLAAPALSGTAEMSATATASGRSVEGMVAALTGSGTAALTGLEVAGIDARAFERIIARADEIGRDIDADRTAAFAPEIVGGGRIAIDRVDAPFTLAGGVLRTPPLFLDAGEALVGAEVRVDLAAGAFSVEGSASYDAGNEAVVGSEPTVGYAVAGPIGAGALSLDTEPLARFLTQRALEREQARVEAMQAGLLEKQRLRREVRYYAQLDEERRIAAEEEARRKAEEAARIAAEEEARRHAEEAARLKAEEEARLKSEAEAKARAEEEARLKAEAEARSRAEAEAEARRKAEAAAKAKAEEEARRRHEEAARIRAEDEARRRAEEQKRLDDEGAAGQKTETTISEQPPSVTADVIRREPLPPPVGPERPPSQPPAATVFDAPTIEQFLKSLAPQR